jgi:hypothetical protein
MTPRNLANPKGKVRSHIVRRTIWRIDNEETLSFFTFSKSKLQEYNYTSKYLIISHTIFAKFINLNIFSFVI